MPKAAPCHPSKPLIARGMCQDCYSADHYRRQSKGDVKPYRPRDVKPYRPQPRKPEEVKLPNKHPLAADLMLHRQLVKAGLSWAACEQIRSLRAEGVGLAAIGAFYGVPTTLVAMVTSHVDLSKIKIEPGDINKMPSARRRHMADLADA